ncbi:MAG: lipid IV(A) 3-deoxy-D-manno-octulosonic acid transferase [Gammaproteobacteria bacterium]|nr:lipid IV(A) 3-deoxy-D-manno-octulosonic acid transferase [Gammaproteobacteria bacterium]NNJ71784.1 3-deoxy-D-manno-octulosonic acid transferase [Enterobacterales bacterium]
MSGLHRWIYSLLLYLLIPVEILRLLYRSRKAPLYRKRWAERFGFIMPEVDGDVIWFHTVSVGETLAALPVINAVREANPDTVILVTTMTPTGSEQVKSHLGDKVLHCYAPNDLPHLMSRFIGKIKPSHLFIMEKELWPNMLYYAKQNKTRVVLMNARMSEKSARGYARFSTLTKRMLQSLDAVAVQTAQDAERFIKLGAPEEKLTIVGNIKYDLKIPLEVSQKAAALRKDIQERPIWLAASTHAGEDKILISAHQQLLQDFPQALLILVPRHPERFNDVFAKCQKSGLQAFRRTEKASPQGQIYLADTMGEILVFCALADAVFVGGSLVNHGGHNCLEAAAFKKPVMSGPNDFNFADVNRQLSEARALAMVNSDNEIYLQLKAWFENDAEAKRSGEAGYQVVLANRGALDKLLKVLEN